MPLSEQQLNALIEQEHIPATLEGELFRRQLRRDYSLFVRWANPRFYMTHFHKYLCDQIQEFLEVPTTKAMDILLLSVPPRHGKSFTVTETLPAWFMGQDPLHHVIIASYESDFAEAFNRRNRDKFNNFTTQIWPDAQPNLKVQGAGMWETSEGGTCRAGGLRAGITGYGAELFIIDDPIKNKEQADSPAVISKIHDEMAPSVQSRIHPGGKLIVIQTRWVESDVIGWILTHWNDYVYKTINLPYEYDEEAAKIGSDPLGRKIGDTLMGAHLGDDEEKMPQVIRNTNSILESKKRLVIQSDGARTWNALYQGRPSAENGNLYNPENWRYYSRSEELLDKADYIGMSVDATFKSTETSDYVAIEVWVLVGRISYLWKLVNKKLTFTETVAKLRQIVDEFVRGVDEDGRPNVIIDELVIEDKANGSAIIDTLKYDDTMPPIVAVTPLGGKLSRGQSTANYVASGACQLPQDLTDEENADIEWHDNTSMTGIQKFVRQHTTFPFGAHDDMVDSQSQILSRIIKIITGDIKLEHTAKPIIYKKWHADQWEDYEQLDEKAKLEYIRRFGAPEEWAPEEYWTKVG